MKVLLINLPFEKIYEGTKLAKMIHAVPPLSLAVIGASLLEEKHEVKVFDFNLPENNLDKFKSVIKNFNPDFIGISFVTPLFSEMKRLVEIVKDINKEIITIGGGSHCSSFPKETLKEYSLDWVVIGEGDFTIKEIVINKDFSKIKGIAYKKNKKIFVNERREPIK